MSLKITVNGGPLDPDLSYLGSGARASIILAQLLLVWSVIVAVNLLLGVAETDSSRDTLHKLAWLSNFALIAELIVLRKSFGSLTSPFAVYAIFLALFTCGQLILFSIGVTPSGFDVLSRESYITVVKATGFYLAGYSLFCLGGVATNELKRHQQPFHNSATSTTTDWQSSLRTVAVVCIVLGVGPFVVQNFHNLRVVLRHGYSGYYDQGARLQTPLLVLGYLFITGLVMLACCGQARLRHFSIITILGIAVVRLVCGDRGEGIVYLLTAFLLSTLFSKVPRRRLIWAGVVALFAIVAIPVVGALRRTYGAGLGGITIGIPVNPVETTLSTIGATLFPLVAVIDLADRGVPATMGMSYIGGIVGVLPDGLLVGPLAAIMNDAQSASPATWLMQQLGMSYGPGFTPFAEAYLNFGWWGGLVAMTFYGVMFSLLLRLPASRVGPDVLRVALVVTTFALIGFSVRGSSNFVFAYWVRYVAIPGLLVVLVARTRAKRRIGEMQHD